MERVESALQTASRLLGLEKIRIASLPADQAKTRGKEQDTEQSQAPV